MQSAQNVTAFDSTSLMSVMPPHTSHLTVQSAALFSPAASGGDCVLLW